MSEKKYYTVEEALAHWYEHIEKQAEILRKNLRKKRAGTTVDHV